MCGNLGLIRKLKKFRLVRNMLEENLRIKCLTLRNHLIKRRALEQNYYDSRRIWTYTQRIKNKN